MEFQRKKYKEFASKQLSGRWKPAVFCSLIIAGISLLFSIPRMNLTYDWNDLVALSRLSIQELWQALGNSNPTTLAHNLLVLIEDIIMLILEIAASQFFLKFSRSPEPVPLKDFFEGFNKWARGILTGLWSGLWLFLWIILVITAGLIIEIPVAMVIPDSELIISLFTLIILVAMLVVMVIKCIEYSHHMLLVAEFPELGIRKALRISILITKGHRMDIFITELTFIPLYLFGIITMGIGLLWMAPFMRMTRINIYHALLKDALETQKLHPEDLN